MGERFEFASDLQRILADGARLAHSEGAREFGIAHVQRALAGERAEAGWSRESQNGLVMFSEALREAMVGAQVRDHERGTRQVNAADLQASLPRTT